MRRLLALSAILLFACSKKSTEKWINAEVLNELDMACGKPVLSFIEDSTAVRSITGKQALEYLGVGLPETLRHTGQKLRVKVRQPQDGEHPFCLGIGFAYPGLVVTDARGR